MEKRWHQWHDIATSLFPQSHHPTLKHTDLDEVDPQTGISLIEAKEIGTNLWLLFCTSEGYCFTFEADNIFEMRPNCIPHLKWHHCHYHCDPKPNLVVHCVQEFHILIFIEKTGIVLKKVPLSGKLPLHPENFCSDCWDLCKWTHHYDYPLSNYPVIASIKQENYIVFGMGSKLVFNHVDKDTSKNFQVSFKPGVMWFANKNMSRYLFIVSHDCTSFLFDIQTMKFYQTDVHTSMDFMHIHTCYDPHNDQFVFHCSRNIENYSLSITNEKFQLNEIPETKMKLPFYCDVTKQIFYKSLKS